MRNLRILYTRCKNSNSSFLHVAIRYLLIRIFYRKTLIMHQKVRIKGMKNLQIKEKVEIGMGYVGFSHRSDLTYLNIKGKLKIDGKFSIGRGCRIDIGENAIVHIGKKGLINCFTRLVIMHELTIGDDSGISWDCHLLDDDFHECNYPGKKEKVNAIRIGNHVWIGCGVKIYKGTVIPDGCIVASDSVVRSSFTVKNALIGGNPAKVLKENVEWFW